MPCLLSTVCYVVYEVEVFSSDSGIFMLRSIDRSSVSYSQVYAYQCLECAGHKQCFVFIGSGETYRLFSNSANNCTITVFKSSILPRSQAISKASDESSDFTS